MTKPLKDFLTITQAAKVLKIICSTAVIRGRLKAQAIGPIRLISESDLQQYKKTRKPGRPKAQKNVEGRIHPGKNLCKKRRQAEILLLQRVAMLEEKSEAH